MEPVSLGPFVLESRLDRGGAGIVWRGHHPGQGVPVAVKILRPTANLDEFKYEIQAVAALHHPGVVLVFDHGVVPPEAEVPEKKIWAGCPWLAMEYASGGSLKSLRTALPWSDIRRVLLSLLDALAHAHARGVIHRDIKPGNILLGDKSDLRPGVKLADFGLARELDDFEEITQVSGTPAYMAPEQFRGLWRAFGPSTDLYSLGIVAWELACGDPPFNDPDLHKVARHHVVGDLPPFRPLMPVPPGFANWIRRMLAANPMDRFQRCADAAWALTGLPDLDEDTWDGTTTTGPIVSNPTMTLDDTILMREGAPTLLDLDAAEEAFVPMANVPPLPIEVPPIPPTWRRPPAPSAPMQLLGAGLNLFGLRSVPLVDRYSERDRMWDALIDATASREYRLLVLQGSAGNGKTRLVEWIAQRAHEVGGATILKAIHGPTGGPMDGLEAMVARHFRAVGQDRRDLLDHLEDHPDVPEGDQAAVAELIHPAPDEDEDALRFAGAEERWAVVERLLARLSAQRPVILWFDDIQWGPDTLAFAHWLIRRDPVGAVLILCTAQEEALGDLASMREALDVLLDQDFTGRLPVGPLGPGDREDLVRALLGLEGPLAKRLADRTGGNPLFTVQLVGDWVARGVLVPGRDGFKLKPGERAILPDSLHEVWAGRLEALLGGRPSSDRDALELAAALGQEVHRGEWALICTQAGHEVPTTLVEALITKRLATLTDEGWAFSHGMLRESLERIAQDEGRWQDHNRVCALGLSSLRRRGQEGRLGRHWYAAGEYARAAELLRRGAATHRSTGDVRQAIPALALCEEALRRAGVPDRDPRWGDFWQERGECRLAMSELDDAIRDARRLLTHARRHKWTGMVGRAHRLIGQVWRQRGDLQQAMDSFEKAAPLLQELGDRKALADTMISLAHTRILAGDIHGATQYLADARTNMEAARDPQGMVTVIRFEGDLARLSGDFQRAWDLFDQAETLARRLGRRRVAATNQHGKAEMDRLLGRLDDAERGYREVIDIELNLGAVPTITYLNLGLCLIARGKYAEAREQLEAVLATWEKDRRRGYLAVAHISIAPAVAGLRDWLALDHHLDQFQDLAAATGMTDIDTAHAAAAAAELCEEAGERVRAKRCWDICLATWEALGSQDEANAALARIRALEER